MAKKTGHRRWGKAGALVPGTHRGDTISAEKRSAVMARIKGFNTTPELCIFKALKIRKIRFKKHVRELAGRPDVVIVDSRVVVFIDGDFWHGWRFPLWQHKLSEKWQQKIAATRVRDRRNFRKLRKSGWKVVRIWEHQIEQNIDRCINRILTATKAKAV